MINKLITCFLIMLLLQGCQNDTTQFPDTYPKWSPDGKEIVFESMRSGNADIWIMQADGSKPSNLTENISYNELEPAWGSKGNLITFTSFRRLKPIRSHIHILDLSSMEILNITVIHLYFNFKSNYEPYMSPDSNLITFNSSGNKADIIIYNLSDYNFQNITEDIHTNFFRSIWSPDGRKLAINAITQPGIWIFNLKNDSFEKIALDKQSRDLAWSNRNMIASTFVASGDNLGIFSIKPDGTEYKILTENGENPTWSPDGSFLAFERPYEDKKNDIWILDIENMRFSNLTHGKGDNGAPAWSPDGSQIAFESDRTGDWDIWVMNADGSNPVNLTGDF